MENNNTPKTRIILEDQNPYVGIENQILVGIGSRRKEWVDAGGGGDFLDATPENKKILSENGSPVIVYPNGRVEPIE